MAKYIYTNNDWVKRIVLPLTSLESSLLTDEEYLKTEEGINFVANRKSNSEKSLNIVEKNKLKKLIALSIEKESLANINIVNGIVETNESLTAIIGYLDILENDTIIQKKLEFQING